MRVARRSRQAALPSMCRRRARINRNTQLGQEPDHEVCLSLSAEPAAGTGVAGDLRDPLVSLASIDPRVHDKVAELVSSGQNVGSLANRASELIDTVSTAVRYQSIENAPMVLFATIGGVLFLFMVRT